jgi:hypothetical protein
MEREFPPYGGSAVPGRFYTAHRGSERIPIGYAEHLSDQFEALTDGDLETLGSKGRT